MGTPRRRSQHKRIGLYGGIANNMYVFAKAFEEHGFEPLFVRDRLDRYPFSQPVWEDARFVFGREELDKAQNWSWKQWASFEAEVDWRSPAWVKDPLKVSVPWKPTIKRGLFDKVYLRCRSKQRPHWAGALDLLSSCDFVVVCGIEGALLAMLSGRPYAIAPHGRDVRLAAGLPDKASSMNPLYRLDGYMEQKLLREAFFKAEMILSADPLLIGGHKGDVLKGLRGCRVVHWGFPLPIRERPSREERLSSLKALLTELDQQFYDGCVWGAMPSRVDFDWKGQDILVQALAALPKENPLRMIVSGWGKDYSEFRAMATNAGVIERFVFLPFAMSKPLLFDLFRSVDFVVDQFKLGTYGAAALEAMSCGAPLVGYIQEGAFERMQAVPPPVFNVSDGQSVSRVLCLITEELGSAESLGRKAQEWIRQHHSFEPAVQAIFDAAEMHGGSNA